MGNNKRFISIFELKAGMVIAEELKIDGVVLVKQGAVTTEPIINKLREKYFFNMVQIYDESTSEEGIPEKISATAEDRQRTVQEVEETFTEFAVDTEKLFRSIENEGKPDIDEIKSFARKIRDELNSTRSVVKNIILNGSGKDVVYRHSVNVTALSHLLGKWIGFDETSLNLLAYSAILHDYGKTKIDPEILNKPGRLTQSEFQIVKNHPVEGYNSIKQLANLDSSVGYGVLMHHERLDGSGYPFGIKEDRIHDFGKIIAIADTFDAINSNRSHKKRKGPFEALELIKKESLGKFDYKYSKIFLDHITNYYMGESVLLNTKKICKIIQINMNDLSRPLLLYGGDFLDLRKEKDLYVEKFM